MFEKKLHKKFNIEIEYAWKKVGDIDLKVGYPNHEKPALYKWIIWNKDNTKSSYVGETTNFSRRVWHYCKPGLTQKTSQRIHGELIKSSKKILYVLDMKKLVVNGTSFTKENLADKYTRRWLEGLLINASKLERRKYAILNR